MVDLSIFSSNIEWSCSQTLSYFSILVVRKSLIRLIQKIHLKKKKIFQREREGIVVPSNPIFLVTLRISRYQWIRNLSLGIY